MTNNEVPPTPQRDVIREVDWLAVAPWLLVLRAVGATIGWPLLVGVIGYAVLDWETQPLNLDRLLNPADLVRYNADVWATNATQISDGVAEISWYRRVVWPTFRRLAWMMLGVVIAQHAAQRLSNSPRIGFLTSLRRALRYGPRVLGAIALLAIPAACCAVFLGVCGLLVHAVFSSTLANGMASIGGVVGGLPLAMLLGVVVYGAPLLVASVVVDDADPFDALSRTVAYVFQKPGSLATCVFLGWIGLVVSSIVIHWLLTTSIEMTNAFTDGAPLALHCVLLGFFPAYFYCAGVATYLVMRRQVDGQPLDEIG
ncbi:hypothetical protein [Botrimarina mediterranea]|uniref:Uncharacterized protein n=1 Tax=Botrimarina mediterranea TaxID=2528022 RepID=A0A518K4D2_9BACT|nr:hypothetical protein [Botrimarina mediterranea]QDV72658.1 hypothetical protein Spa11_08390 [Botrimarina mediterranea]QDV77230.1 hypothetical protein K2D_08200 [Planctomycetes bacterium K2D]